MSAPDSNEARVAAGEPPFDADIQASLDAVMQGLPPLRLFATLARDRRLFFKFFRGALLDQGHLTPRQREIVIDRTTALCGAEYEWGVHVAAFAGVADLSREQITSLTFGGVADDCWDDQARALIDLCDALHATATVDDDLWARVAEHFSDEAIIELLLLAGFYHSTSFLVNGLALPLEEGMPRFEDYR